MNRSSPDDIASAPSLAGAAEAAAAAPPPRRRSALAPAALSLLFALLFVAVALWLALAAPDQAGAAVWWLLAVLAAVGVFALSGFSVGLFQLTPGVSRPTRLSRAIVDGALAGMAAVDARGEIIWCNGAWLRAVGRDGAGPAALERAARHAPEVSEALYRLARSARAGVPAHDELRFPAGATPDGAPCWRRVEARLLGEGRRAPLLWTVTDVTADRERQERVFQELQHVISFLDEAPAGFMSIEADGEISYMNATLAGWLGLDLASAGAGGVRIEDIAPHAAAGRLLAAPPAGKDHEILDLDLRRRDGHILPVRALHRVPAAEAGARPPSRTVVLSRMSVPGTAAGSRHAEARFARFFNNTPVAIATVAPDGRILSCNASFQRLFGPELIEAGARALVTDKDGERLEAALRAAASQQEVAPFDAQVAGDGGRCVRVYVSSVSEMEGEGESAVIYALDITEQRALEAQFAQAQKMNAVGQLAGGVAHDFNNVLQAIIGFCELLLGRHRPTDPSFQDIMQIKTNANRAAALVRHLLAFSRRQTLRPQVMRVGDVLADVSLLLKRLLGERVDLDVHHGRDIWPVKADINQFEQVIMNLAVNARDAMPDGGRLSIRTSNVSAAESRRYDESMPAADYVMIEVADTGVGMPPEVLSQIFEPFFTTKEVGKGTGLGLSTVYGIVKQTDGYILCESEVGKGTTFRIFLPRYVESQEETAAAAGAAAGAPARKPAADLTGRGVILLVEDEEAVRAFASRALAARGYTVLEAASGAEAIQLLEERDDPVDLVVSDVVMPEMDGPTLLRELRARNIGARIVFVSGYAEDAFRRNLPEGETFVFLPKPFTLKQLIEAVKAQTG
ncbi:cell cycle histidine kinase CckA [Camelimonas abortus]|uniref:histidine kinase n=1 Tax=Camelimonas abortus TaxID=1017184 RepID=A0ABV7LCP7_9HYPH